jgi:hypothetical protein
MVAVACYTVDLGVPEQRLQLRLSQPMPKRRQNHAQVPSVVGCYVVGARRGDE